MPSCSASSAMVSPVATQSGIGSPGLNDRIYLRERTPSSKTIHAISFGKSMVVASNSPKA